MSELRDRIGRAICGATSAGKLFPWDTLNEREHKTWLGYADAVIAELGLRVQVAGPDGIAHGQHRYISDWITNE